MSKVMLSVGIIVFFLAYPIPLIIMQSEHIAQTDTSSFNDLSTVTIGNILNLYFSAMYLTFTGVGFLSIVVIIFQILAAVSLFFALRG